MVEKIISDFVEIGIYNTLTSHLPTAHLPHIFLPHAACASHAQVSLNCPSHQLHSAALLIFSFHVGSSLSPTSLEFLHPLPSAHVPHTKCPAAECSSRWRGQVGTCCSTSAVIVGAVPAKCQASGGAGRRLCATLAASGSEEVQISLLG